MRISIYQVYERKVNGLRRKEKPKTMDGWRSSKKERWTLSRKKGNVWV